MDEEKEKNISEEKDGFPGKPTSVWLDTTSDTDYPILPKDFKVDNLVVGGGIAGLMTAYFLKEEGAKVAVIEADRIVRDVTGYTTAKITVAHGAIYHYLTQKFGETKAKMYADANQAGFRKMISTILSLQIDCDLQKQSAFIYTEKLRKIESLKKEALAAKKLGLPADFTDKTPLDFIKGAVEYKNQAQFHPRKFLLSLAKEISRQGGQIFENTRALDIQRGSENIVVTDKGAISAKNIIITTHFPFYDNNRFFAKLYPHRSYVLGIKLKEPAPEGMYFSVDGRKNAIRNYQIGKKKLLLVSGGSEKAGQKPDTYDFYEEIKEYTQNRFKIDSIDYHWFTQDNHTPDRVPYIGRIPKSDSIYVATGFGGWGMTTAAASAIIISDQILGKVNSWTELFDPRRKDYVHSARRFFSENIKLAEHLLARKLKRHPFELPTGFEKGEGKIIKLHGKRTAVYRDKSGKIYSVSPKCTHMGCTVNWNPTEKTWDCPCHGSRFNYDGKVIHGPAKEDLKKINLD